MKPPTERDPWSGVLALACLCLMVAILLIALAGGRVQ